MKRIGALRALFLVALLAGCRPLMAAPEVVVTIKPIHALAAGVMEGVGEPALLMEGVASPHTYQMRPSDAALLAGADLVVWVAPTVESTIPATLGMLPEDVETLEVSEVQGLGLLPAREPGIRTGTGEGEAPHTEEGHIHGGEGVDPHVWLDPANAIVLTRTLVEALSALDADNADTYAANGAAQVRRLQALDADLREALAPVQEVPFMTFHDAFQYFEAAYGLAGVASIAIGPERAPGGRTVMALRTAIEERRVACVFAEPQFEPRLVDTLIEGTGARAGTLDPLGTEVAAGPGAYEAMMRDLARDAVACLAGPDSE